jgi:hypothetical protein
VVILVLLAGCNGRTKLPSDPGLLTEDFGAGISIGMSRSEAVSKQQAAGPLKIEVIAPESLQTRNPYTEAGTDSELLLVVVPSDGELRDTVSRVMCYSAGSVANLRFRGERLAFYAPDDIERIFGVPASRNQSSDSATHLVYYFAHPEDDLMRLKLTTSHNVQGQCFALELQLEAAPRE